MRPPHLTGLLRVQGRRPAIDGRCRCSTTNLTSAAGWFVSDVNRCARKRPPGRGPFPFRDRTLLGGTNTLDLSACDAAGVTSHRPQPWTRAGSGWQPRHAQRRPPRRSILARHPQGTERRSFSTELSFSRDSGGALEVEAYAQGHPECGERARLPGGYGTSSATTWGPASSQRSAFSAEQEPALRWLSLRLPRWACSRDGPQDG